jgi:hypothetical protein
MRMRLVLAGVVAGTTAGVAVTKLQGWRRTWGIDPDEGRRVLPGDQVVPDPMAIETRGITIDAPPDRVWPWLMQMGFGKAGWYSYDRLDQRGSSVDRIVEAWQTLGVGDIVPTHPGGGFVVEEIDPGHAIVLRSDTELVTSQAAAWMKRVEADRAAAGTPTESTPAGLAASSAMLGATPQQFAASWAFVIEPLGGGRSRLVERFRVWFGESSRASRFVTQVVGFGVFVMLQKQMVGIKTRAERLAGDGSTSMTAPATASPPTVEPSPPATNGHEEPPRAAELETTAVG